MANNKIYIAGPIGQDTEGKKNNEEVFRLVDYHLTEGGWDTINPFDVGLDDYGDASWEDHLKADIPHLLRADSIVLLPDWEEESKGARLEAHIADQLNYNVLKVKGFDVDGPIIETAPRAFEGPSEESDLGKNVLDEAKSLVYGDRNKDYGHPAEDYRRTAKIWSGIIDDKLTEDLTAKEACMMMIGVKMSREMNRPNRDNRVDGAGYFECVNRIANYNKTDGNQ